MKGGKAAFSSRKEQQGHIVPTFCRTEDKHSPLRFINEPSSLYNVSIQINGEEMKKKYPPEPNGKNIEIALELLELSLLLKRSVKKAVKKKL